MKEKRKQHFRDKLYKEKKQVEELINKIKEFEPVKFSSEANSELSIYSNHPADIGQEFSDKAKGIALEKTELEKLHEIKESLYDMEHGTYGICRICKKQIPDDRLEAVPYAKYCVQCKNEQDKLIAMKNRGKPNEEKVIEETFGAGNNNNSKAMFFDIEDSYLSVEMNNELENVYAFNDYNEEDENIGFVEEVEKISNQQYINQLPD